MIRSVIVDDNIKARTSLKEDLSAYCPGIEILGEAQDVASGIQLINSLKPQLVFLDIDMPDGTGFDLLEKIKAEKQKIDFGIIFTTAHDKFALKAIKFSALDYLLKPVVPEELVAAVTKAQGNILDNKTSNVPIDALLNILKKPEKTLKRIVLTTLESAGVYDIDQITRCESEGNYTKFYFSTEKPLLVSRTLKEFEEILYGSGFERVHNSHLINLDYVKTYMKSDGGYLIMKDGANIPISQRKKDQIVSILSSR